jgi:2-oxoisovalerate dehydrogenase E1 component
MAIEDRDMTVTGTGYWPRPCDLDGEPPDRHTALGLSGDDVAALYRQVLLARRLDERAWSWNRQGKTPFVVSGEGHECLQLVAAAAIRPRHDWVCPYYRDLALMIGLGASAEEILTQVLARAADPNSGGRQMPNHWGNPARRVLSTSSCIATQLPHAVGIAVAERQRGSDAIVLATFGEGATAKGDFHEALNWAAIHALPVVFLCEANGYAISVPERLECAVPPAERAAAYGIPGTSVDGNDPFACLEVMRGAVAHARAGHGPSIVEARTYRTRPHTSDDDDRRYRSADEVDAWRQVDPLVRLRRYLLARGLRDALQLAALEASVQDEVALAAEVAESLATPAPETATDNVYAAPLGSHRSARPRPSSVPEAALPETRHDGDVVTNIEAVRQALAALLEHDDRALVFGQDVGLRGGVFLATDGLARRFPGRVFDTPISESCIVGVAIGAAVAGGRPIAEIQFADFTHSAFDQLVSEASRLHYRSDGAFSCPLVLRVAYGAGIHGSLYHSQSIEAFYAHVPGLKVVVPSTPADLVGLLRSALDDPDPVIVLEHKKTYRAIKGPLPGPDHRVPIGRASVARPGRDATVVTYGWMRHLAVQVADALAHEGIEVEVLDLRTISPLDRDAIHESVARTSRCLVLTEDTYSFGVAAEVSAWIMEAAFYDLDQPVVRLTVPDVPTMPFATALEDALLPDERAVADALRALVRA